MMEDWSRSMKSKSPLPPQDSEPRISSAQQAKSVSNSFRFAWGGLVFVLGTQRHMRVHFAIIGLVLVAAWGLGVSSGELLHLLLAMALVLITEVFNTSVEVMVDLLVDTYHSTAKVAKDVAAGAVLIASLYAVAVAAVVFLRNERLLAIFRKLPNLSPAPQVSAIQLVIIGAIIVVLIIVGLKKGTKRGSLLRGGIISGHAAIGFLIATSIIILTRDIAVTALALALALLVSQSRMQARIHSPAEVIIGVVVGTVVAAVIFLWPVS